MFTFRKKSTQYPTVFTRSTNSNHPYHQGQAPPYTLFNKIRLTASTISQWRSIIGHQPVSQYQINRQQTGDTYSFCIPSTSKQIRTVVPQLPRLVALCLHFIAEHLEAVEAGVVDATRFALGAEVSVTGSELVDAAVEARIAFAEHLPVRLHLFLQVQQAHLEDVDQVHRLQMHEVRVLFQLVKRLRTGELDAPATTTTRESYSDV